MAAAFLAVALSLAPAQTGCAGNGLTLATTPPRLGDPYAITLSGPPNASGVLGFDVIPGPIGTSFGLVCLGLSPALQYAPIALDAFGNATLTGFLPPVPALTGVGGFMQAAVTDTNQPAGMALSNGVHPVLRPPRLFFVDRGDFSNQVPGAWVAYDVLTDSMGTVVPLTAPVRDAVAIPALGWIAFALYDGTVTFVDALTSNVVLSVPFMPPGAIKLTVSGTTLLAETTSQSTQLLHFIRLPLGNVQTQPLPVAGLYRLVAPPGGASVYVFGGPSGTVFPYDIASGAPLTPISLASNDQSWQSGTDFAVHGQILAILMHQGPTVFLNAINTVTNTALLPSPTAITSYPTYCGPGPVCFPNLRSGPGTTGPALFLRVLNSLFEISPQTLTATSAPIPIPYVSDLRLSNGGTDWLIPVSPGAPCFTCPPGTLQRLDPVTHAITTIDSAGAPSVAVLPSGSLNLAFGWTAVELKRYTTDPPGPGIVMPVPISLANMIVVVD